MGVVGRAIGQGALRGRNTFIGWVAAVRMAKAGERHLAAELRGIGASALEQVPKWKQESMRHVKNSTSMLYSNVRL